VENVLRPLLVCNYRAEDYTKGALPVLEAVIDGPSILDDVDPETLPIFSTDSLNEEEDGFEAPVVEADDEDDDQLVHELDSLDMEPVVLPAVNTQGLQANRLAGELVPTKATGRGGR
jgi:hypothetical protein